MREIFFLVAFGASFGAPCFAQEAFISSHTDGHNGVTSKTVRIGNPDGPHLIIEDGGKVCGPLEYKDHDGSLLKVNRGACFPSER